MAGFWNNFVLTFIPLFIVIDAFGNLPFLLAVYQPTMERREQRKMVHYAIITATVIGLVFLFFGRFILMVMDISVGAFAIAGGLILLILSIQYMTSGHMVNIVTERFAAIVPIGTPLTVGPAAITTLILLATQFPIYTVLISFVLNMLVAWGIFLLGQRIARFLGDVGIRVISRVFSLLLAAIAVSMILRGLDLTGIVNLVE